MSSSSTIAYDQNGNPIYIAMPTGTTTTTIATMLWAPPHPHAPYQPLYTTTTAPNDPYQQNQNQYAQPALAQHQHPVGISGNISGNVATHADIAYLNGMVQGLMSRCEVFQAHIDTLLKRQHELEQLVADLEGEAALMPAYANPARYNRLHRDAHRREEQVTAAETATMGNDIREVLKRAIEAHRRSSILQDIEAVA